MCKYGKSGLRAFVCVCLCAAMQLMWGLMQKYCSLRHARISDYIPHTNATNYCVSCTTHHCLLLTKSLSMSLCLLLSLSCVFNVPACINVSRPPHRLLIYESYPGLSLLPPEGSIDVKSVTRRITSCPQTSWIFFWQPVASSISDLDDTLKDDILKCCMKFWVISFCWQIIFIVKSKYFCGCHNHQCFVVNLALNPHMKL